MEFEEGSSDDRWFLDPNEIKAEFESSPIIGLMMDSDEADTDGVWDENLWEYSNPYMQRLYDVFMDGFIVGAFHTITCDENISEDDDMKRKEAQRRMESQMNETALVADDEIDLRRFSKPS